jgi:hypothetical protein
MAASRLSLARLKAHLRLAFLDLQRAFLASPDPQPELYLFKVQQALEHTILIYQQAPELQVNHYCQAAAARRL